MGGRIHVDLGLRLQRTCGACCMEGTTETERKGEDGVVWWERERERRGEGLAEGDEMGASGGESLLDDGSSKPREHGRKTWLHLIPPLTSFPSSENHGRFSGTTL